MTEPSPSTRAASAVVEPLAPSRPSGPGGPSGARPSVPSALRSLLAPEGPAPWWHALVLFLGVAALVWAAVWIGNTQLPHDARYPARTGIAGGTFFEGWQRWDAYWYRAIVRDGYVYYPGDHVQSSVAFWPSYPVVVRALSWAFPSIFITGSIVTLASGATLAVCFRRWAERFLAPAAAVTALLVLLVYPYGWYQYGAVYADALFLAATVGAFLLLERDRVVWAGLLGAVASAGRPSGMVVAVALLFRLVERRNAARGERGLVAALDVRGLTRRDAPVLLAFAGVGAWAAYLWARFGDPLLFATVEGARGWDQAAGPATWFKLRLLEAVRDHPFSPGTLNLLLQAAMVVGALALVPRVVGRFGWAYGLYVVGVAGIALVGTKDFMGSGRYVLAAFPALAVAGELLAGRPRLRRAVLPLSLCVLLGLAVLFGRGTYLS